MDDIKKLLGDDLFAQVQTKLGTDSLLFLHKKEEKVIIDDGKMVPQFRFKEINEERNAYKAQVDSLTSDLSKLKKDLKDNEGATAKIQEIQDQMKAKEAEVANTKKKFALRDALREAQANHVDLLEAKFDLSKIEVGEDGKIKDVENLLKPVKETYKDLFGVKKREGYDPKFPDGNPPADIYTMDEIKNMPQDEKVKNIDKINKSVSFYSKKN